MPLTKLLDKAKTPGSRTHAHYAGEFGASQRAAKAPEYQNATKSAKTSDPAHRAGRAEHFAGEARKAASKYATAKTNSEKAVHEATVAHAADRANVHANFVKKSQPGSELADKATLHAKIAETIHDKLVASKDAPATSTTPHDAKSLADTALEKVRASKELARAHAEDGDMTGAKAHLDDAKKHLADVEKHSDAQIAGAKDDRAREDAQFEKDDRKMAADMHLSSATQTMRMYDDAAKGFGDESLLSGRDSVKSGESMSAARYTKDSIAFANNLTDDQKYAVQNYSNHTDRILNSVLRETKGAPDLTKDVYKDIAHDPGSAMKRDPRQTKDTSLRRELHDLDSAIASNKIQEDTKTYRTLSDPGGKIAGNLKVGSSFVDHGYVSTTGNKTVIDKFYHGESSDRIDMHITLKKGSAAAPIGHMSTFGGEREMLLPRGSSFRVTKIVHDERTGGKQIHVELS